MKPPSDWISVISLTLPPNREHFLSIQKRNGLFISVPHSQSDISTILEVGCGLRYLDRFILLLPDDPKQQKQLWQKFYSVFGESYEQLINVQHNIFSIQNMLQYIGQNVVLKSDSNVLDYGCGSGLALYANCPAVLTGYEPVAAMRVQARRRGYRVLGQQEFLRLSSNFFDAGFANYVFHMAVDEVAVYEISQRLKSGSIFLANYYKGLNAERVSNYFVKYGFSPRLISLGNEKLNECCYEYRKK